MSEIESPGEGDPVTHETDPDDVVDSEDEDYAPTEQVEGISLVPTAPPPANPEPHVPEVVEEDSEVEIEPEDDTGG